MNGYAFTMVFIVIVLLSLLGWHVVRAAVSRGDRQLAIEERRLEAEQQQRARELELREREVIAAEQAVPTLKAPPVTDFPPEVMSFVSRESEPWAREDMVQCVADSFVEAGGDWGRAAQFVGQRIAAQAESRLPPHLLRLPS